MDETMLDELETGTEDWLLVMDPGWEASEDDEAPPFESVMGVWPIESDGKTGKFRTNPSYEPSDPDAPTDPIDGQLRALIAKEGDSDRLRLLLRDSLVDVAMNGDDRPLIVRSPDDQRCLLVVTAEPHRKRVSSPEWQRVELDGLLELMTEFENILVNPGGPAAVRLLGSFLRDAAGMSEEDAAAEYERFAKTIDEPFPIMRWEVGFAEDDDVEDTGADDDDDDEADSDETPLVVESEVVESLADLSAVSAEVTPETGEVTPETGEVTPEEETGRRPGLRRRRATAVAQPDAAAEQRE